MWGKKIYTITYRMTDAQYDGDGPAYVVDVLASKFEEATAAIKTMFVGTGCRPRKFSNFKLIEESETTLFAYGTTIIATPYPYRAEDTFNDDDTDDE
jgi:hypothetical protein